MLYFDGYCPECLLQGQQVEMKLNKDDFWESPETGLQIAVSPPFATLLRWRGQGQFREASLLTVGLVHGLLLTEAQKEEGQEIQPDAEHVLQDEQALEWYLHEVYDNFKAFKSHQFNAKDPVFDVQRKVLNAITTEAWQNIFNAFDAFCCTGININILHYKSFKQWQGLLQVHRLIFDFNWHAWHRGWINIRNPKFNFEKLSMLELSMCLSAIFLSEPYDEGSIEFYYNNKTLEKIMKRLQQLKEVDATVNSIQQLQ